MKTTDDERVLAFRQRVAETLQVPLEELDVESDADLLSVDGLVIGDNVIDSLTLVDLITIIEDEFEISLQDLIDRDEPLTFKVIVESIMAQGTAP